MGNEQCWDGPNFATPGGHDSSNQEDEEEKIRDARSLSAKCFDPKQKIYSIEAGSGYLCLHVYLKAAGKPAGKVLQAMGSLGILGKDAKCGMSACPK